MEVDERDEKKMDRRPKERTPAKPLRGKGGPIKTPLQAEDQKGDTL